MKNALRELWETMKPQINWVKKHWKGFALTYMIFAIPELLFIGKELYDNHKWQKEHKQRMDELNAKTAAWDIAYKHMMNDSDKEFEL